MRRSTVNLSAPPPLPDASDLPTDYEQQRLANIRQNQSLLKCGRGPRALGETLLTVTHNCVQRPGPRQPAAGSCAQWLAQEEGQDSAALVEIQSRSGGGGRGGWVD